MGIKRIASYVVVFLVALCLGAGSYANMSPQTGRSTKYNTTAAVQTPKAVTSGAAGLVIKSDYPNPAMVEFILTEPIAPDFYVDALTSCYDVYLDDPERWDPMGIGVEDATNLMHYIRTNVPGVTEDIRAKGYCLRVAIAESHLVRKDDIIAEITTIIQEMHKA